VLHQLKGFARKADKDCMDSANKLAPSSEQKSTPETSSGGATLSFDFKGLEKRLADLIDKDGGGRKLSFGYVVLSSVVRGQYDRAQKELESVYVGFEEFPAFAERSKRFVEHAKGLVMAIKTKHEVGKSPHINKSKQKELSNRIAEHFVDLKKTLVTIEKVQKSVRASDLSSTIFFFKACFYSLLAVFAAYTIYVNAMYSDTFSFRDIIQFFDFQWPD
jgi:hypothetical protein